MSGGSLEYVYQRVYDAADSIGSNPASPHHLAFAHHLRLVAKALHDVEWVMSADYQKGDDIEAIRKVVDKADVLKAATEAAIKARDELQSVLSDG